MSEKRLRELTAELKRELDRTDGVDAELVSTIQKLQEDIEDLVDPDTDSSNNTVMDDAIALEASFAVHYPVAEKILRELINTLSRIGI
jgi:hypothetical protein